LGAIAVYLVGGGRPQGGVKGQVRRIALGGLGLDIATALALGAGLTATAGAGAGESIQGSIQPSRVEFFAGVNLIAPFPPMAILW
jgi:hypothetical protein